jgi:hypothetical protein
MVQGKRKRSTNFHSKIVDILCPMCDRFGLDCKGEKTRVLNCILAFRNYYMRTETEKVKRAAKHLPICQRYVDDDMEWI